MNNPADFSNELKYETKRPGDSDLFDLANRRVQVFAASAGLIGHSVEYMDPNVARLVNAEDEAPMNPAQQERPVLAAVPAVEEVMAYQASQIAQPGAQLATQPVAETVPAYDAQAHALEARDLVQQSEPTPQSNFDYATQHERADQPPATVHPLFTNQQALTQGIPQEMPGTDASRDDLGQQFTNIGYKAA